MSINEAITCEHVRLGHPDKICDQIGDAIIDEALVLARNLPPRADQYGLNSLRFGLEVIAKDHFIIITGEARLPQEVAYSLNIDSITKSVWKEIGYPDADKLTVINHIKTQQPELQASSDRLGAGDQGVMIGYACSETESLMPREYVIAREIIQAISKFHASGSANWVMPDGKCQVTVLPSGEVTSVVVGVQHTSSIDGIVNDPEAIQDFIRSEIINRVIKTVVPSAVNRAQITVNGTGSFAIGGPTGDAGVLGRKIVVDAYGPRVPVGGGAFSGKDPTKVDRSAAYMARHIARTIVLEQGAMSAKVVLAYAIGKHQPEMIVGQTDTGTDVSPWIRHRFPDLSPPSIAERFNLWRKNPDGAWSYKDTASNGHFGRQEFPWEHS
jgi:S-adenosylmethionine synthetase